MRSVIFVTLMLPSLAQAGGFYFPDAGIVASGRGGAFVASADNQFAQYYNPAGLIHVKRPTINIGASAVAQKVSFTAINEDGETYDPVENLASPYTIPQLGFATPRGDHFAFALGFYSPFAPGTEYEAQISVDNFVSVLESTRTKGVLIIFGAGGAALPGWLVTGSACHATSTAAIPVPERSGIRRTR